jgi:hypothetical protein
VANRIVITAHQVFNPPAAARRPSASQPRPTGRTVAARTLAARTVAARAYLAGRQLRPAACLSMLTDFYRDPLAWFGGLVSLLVLAYAGGAVMFVLHAVVLGELGPAISPVEHWALDSTLGFVGLAPLVALVVPVAAWLVRAEVDGEAVPALSYAAIGGTLFGLATAPAPIVHDLLVGRGTWLANRVTESLGGPSVIGQHVHGDTVPQVVSIASQVAVGIPTYILMLWLALRLVHAGVRQHEALRNARAVLSRPEA